MRLSLVPLLWPRSFLAMDSSLLCLSKEVISSPGGTCIRVPIIIGFFGCSTFLTVVWVAERFFLGVFLRSFMRFRSCLIILL